MSAVHTVTVEGDEEDGRFYATSFRFTCTGTAEDICHQWCADGCEEFCDGDSIVLWPNEAPLIAQAPTGAHQWRPDPKHGESCRVVDWLDGYGGHDTYADEDEPHRPGTHRIHEEWDGDCYVWTYWNPAPAEGTR